MCPLSRRKSSKLIQDLIRASFYFVQWKYQEIYMVMKILKLNKKQDADDLLKIFQFIWELNLYYSNYNGKMRVFYYDFNVYSNVNPIYSKFL